MDKQLEKILRREIREVVRQEVRAAIREALEQDNERYVSDKVLMEHIGCLTPSWFRSYGDTLPRTNIIVTEDDTNKEHRTGWCYPLNRLKRMLISGELKNLRV